MKRYGSIDSTRGLVMIIMALDHVREFLHTTSMSHDPTNLQNTTASLFMTRWITHLCAPAFVFLAGMSAFISMQKKNDLAGTRKFLLSRGLWLVILEFTVINYALWFDIHFSLFLMEVIAAIGLSFIILALMIRLPSGVIGIVGLTMVLSGIILQSVKIPESNIGSAAYAILFRPGMIQITEGHAFFSAYPLVPWLGIMLCGFSAGSFYNLEPERRRKVLLKTGSFMLLAFIVLRSVNDIGDPSIWTVQKSYLFTALSFINVTKYPPSFLFTILFLSITLIQLSQARDRETRITGFLSVYGRVPLFYFVIHLFVIHILMFPVLFIQGFGTKDFIFGAFRNGRPENGGGLELTGVLIIWIVVVIVLYPVCKWYGNYKATHPEKWILRYL